MFKFFFNSGTLGGPCELKSSIKRTLLSLVTAHTLSGKAELQEESQNCFQRMFSQLLLCVCETWLEQESWGWGSSRTVSVQNSSFYLILGEITFYCLHWCDSRIQNKSTEWVSVWLNYCIHQNLSSFPRNSEAQRIAGQHLLQTQECNLKETDWPHHSLWPFSGSSLAPDEVVLCSVHLTRAWGQ